MDGQMEVREGPLASLGQTHVEREPAGVNGRALKRQGEHKPLRHAYTSFLKAAPCRSQEKRAPACVILSVAKNLVLSWVPRANLFARVLLAHESTLKQV